VRYHFSKQIHLLNPFDSRSGHSRRTLEDTGTDRQAGMQSYRKTDGGVYNLAPVDYQQQTCQRQRSSACNIRPMSAGRRPETEKAIYINRRPALRPSSDILGCRIDADRAVRPRDGRRRYGRWNCPVARARRRRRRSIDGRRRGGRHGHLAGKTSTATNFSHWVLGARRVAIDRRASVLGRLMNRCVTSSPSQRTMKHHRPVQSTAPHFTPL